MKREYLNHMERKMFSTFLAAMLVIFMMSALSFQQFMIQQTPPTIVRVDPTFIEFSSNATGQEFTVNVKIINVTNLYGFDIIFSWNTTFLEYVTHTVKVPINGTPPHPDGILWKPIMPIKDEVDVAAGTYWIAYSSMAPAPSFNGTGIAFNITLKVKYHPFMPTAYVPLKLESVDLATQAGTPISHIREESSVKLLQLSDAPDVAITAVEAPALAPICKDPAKVNVTVKNLGRNSVSNATITLSMNATTIGSVTNIALESNEAKILFFNVSTSFLWPGTYILNATVIPLANEIYIDNNWNTTTMDTYAVTGYDVAITAVEAPALAPICKDPAKVNVTVANLGDYNETVTVRLFVNGTSMATKTVNITTGEAKIIFFNVSTSFLWPGTYILNATVDRIACETNITNNWMTTSMDTYSADPTLYDLAIVDIVAPDSAVNCTSVTVVATVKNVGAYNESSTVRLFRGTTSIGSVTVSAIEPNETRNIVFTMSTTGLTPGIHVINASVDRIGCEVNMNNNWMTKNIEIVYGVDFAVIGLTTNVTWVQIGSIIEIKATVANLEAYREQTFNVTVTYGKQRYDTTVILGPKTNQTITINWDTSEEEPCLHPIVANVTLSPEDCFPANNRMDTAVSLVPYMPPPAIIKCEPESIVGGIGATFDVSVDIEDLEAYWDLAAFDIILTYNTTMLDAVSVELGDFAKAFNLTYQIIHEIDDIGGYVRMAYLWDFINISPENKPVPYGSGTLFTITFQIIEEGKSDLTFSSVDLAAYENQTKWCIIWGPQIHYTPIDGLVIGDVTPPIIISVIQYPLPDNVQPTDDVRINATVTDTLSGVKTVILWYTTDNGTSWNNIIMSPFEGNIYNATIPQKDYCTHVWYYIEAVDWVENEARNPVIGYHIYHVIPEFPPTQLLFWILFLQLIAAIFAKTRAIQRRVK